MLRNTVLQHFVIVNCGWRSKTADIAKGQANHEMNNDLKNKLNFRTWAFVTSLLSLVLTGCLTTSDFQAWDGPPEIEGQGGAFITKDGIDIYSAGAPKRRCRVLGIISTSTMSSAEMMALFGNSWSASGLAKQAKARGGNAIILTDDKNKLLGWSSSGTATGYQYGNTATAYGSSRTHAQVSRERVAVLVKYLDAKD